MIEQDKLWSLSLDQLGRLYREVLTRNDVAEIRALILADRFFLLTMVLDVKVAWHPWVLARCREVERDPDEHLDVWSRGHFKSTIITFAGVTHYVLSNPEKAVCILSYKAGAAEAFSAQIKSAFESNDILLKCFPDILWSERNDHKGDQWTTSDFTVKRKTGRKEASVSTSGLISGMRTGGHYDLLVYDDTVTYESVSTPEMIQRTTDAWSMSLNLGTVSDTRHWYIGTRYAMFDTYYTMLRTGTIKERRHICHDDKGEPVLLPRSEYDKKKAEMSTKDWASQMLQVPIGDGELMFREEWLNTFSRVPEIPMNYYIFVDTALTQGQKSDYTCMWVVGLGSDGRYYAIPKVRDRIKQSERCDKIFELVEEWQPQVVFWEENASVDDADYIRDKMDTRGHFNLKTFRQTKTQGSKYNRIGWLEPLFREGLIWMPIRSLYRQADGTTKDLMLSFKRDEYLSYPSVSHDDMLDSLANVKHPDLKMYMEFPVAKRNKQAVWGEVDRQRLVKNDSESLFGR